LSFFFSSLFVLFPLSCSLSTAMRFLSCNSQLQMGCASGMDAACLGGDTAVVQWLVDEGGSTALAAPRAARAPCIVVLR
jgi:hypothetical protein